MEKLSSNAERIWTILKDFPNGIKAKMLMQLTNLPKTTLYEHLDSLVEKGYVENRNRKWFPKIAGVEKPSLKENSIWREMNEIGCRALSEPTNAWEQMELFIVKLPKPLKDKIKPLKLKLDTELEAIEKRNLYDLGANYRHACRKAVFMLIDELSNMLQE